MIAPHREQCCGCTACSSICANHAITMKKDPMGFMYPSVDTSLCTGCGLCEKVCPFIERPSTTDSTFVPNTHACRNNDVGEIERSRSGAIFPILAEMTINDGGAVYGAGFADHFVVTHKKAENKDSYQEFRGSKYAQSNIQGILKSVKDDLRTGKKVLFSGTPCQIAGLRLYLGRKTYDNLLLIDIICHGVSSPAIWDDYITFLEHRTRKKIISADFRDKSIFGWSGIHKESFVFDDNKKRTFDYVYYNDRIIRPSCHVCHYCSTERFSDITIGDLWGWRNICPESFNADDKGCSFVMCNTQRGFDAFKAILQRIESIEVKLQDCIQPNLERPTPKHAESDAFENDYIEHGFKYVRKKYGLIGIQYQTDRIVNFIKRRLKTI